MTVYTEKLNRLHETIALVARSVPRSLAFAMSASSGETVIAVGSGGSAVVAEYFAACRAALGYPPTIVATPLAYAFDSITSLPLRVFLFSASGSNPDIMGAFEHARALGAPLEVVTCAPEGELAQRSAAIHVHVAPVADLKDGFLATHSLVAATTSILLASDYLGSGPRIEDRRAQLLSEARRWLGSPWRSQLLSEPAVRASSETVLVLFDPHARALASLIETSLWESGLAAVQAVDFRNFAHGRHVWLTGDRAASILALLTEDSRLMWSAISASLPQSVPALVLPLGSPGRTGLFAGLLAGFSYVEALGKQRNIDPGKPGVSDFGRALYAMPALRGERPSAMPVRRKRLAHRKVDPHDAAPDWEREFERALAELSDADVRGVVLDYDGTVVATDRRLEPPETAILSELVRLADSHLLIAFATGRGGSVGRVLRDLLPQRLHDDILVGYYNGGLIRPLSDDIEANPPAQDDDILAFFKALEGEGTLFGEKGPKLSTLQVSIPSGSLANFADGLDALQRLLAVHAPNLRMIRSGHAIDVVPRSSSKARVVEHLRGMVASEAQIISFGDSGDAQGNDFELFSRTLGISVGRVCHRPGFGWNFAPGKDDGPLELLRVLRSVKIKPTGGAEIDVHGLFGVL